MHSSGIIVKSLALSRARARSLLVLVKNAQLQSSARRRRAHGVLCKAWVRKEIDSVASKRHRIVAEDSGGVRDPSVPSAVVDCRRVAACFDECRVVSRSQSLKWIYNC